MASVYAAANMTHLTRMAPFTRALALAAALLAVAGTLALILPAASSQAATPALCKSQTAPVASRGYTVENNEWGSSEPECITTNGNASFSVSNSSIANSTYGAPGGYPAIYRGCHWGACTRGSGFPIQVSDIGTGTVTTSWSTTQPGGSNDYDVAYDIWFNQTPTTSGQPNGTELMIWLNHNGPVQPFGSKVASNVSIGGRGYDVWFGQQGWNTLSYTMTTGTTAVSNLDLQPLIADAISRGYLKPSWYLIDVEAGFEIWQGGTGLATNSFSVTVAGRAHSANLPPTSNLAPASASTPASASPSASASSASPSATASSPSPSATASSPSPSASPSSASPSAPSASPAPNPTDDISLQAISPNPPSTGTSTNVTVDYKNVGSTAATNLTLVTRLVNSGGTIVGSQAQTGQTVQPQQTLNESYAWTAASPGTYSIEALVQDSSGKTLEQAKVGTLTVS